MVVVVLEAFYKLGLVVQMVLKWMFLLCFALMVVMEGCCCPVLWNFGIVMHLVL